MRHRKKSEKFSRSRAQRKALIKALLRAVIISERITTTTSKAKYMKAEVDKLITVGKKGTLAGRRLAFSKLEDKKLVKKLFEVIAPRFGAVNGGYTRVLRLGTRAGDGASISLLELTKMQKKIKPLKEAKGKRMAKSVEKSEEKVAKDKKGLIGGVKKMFKKGQE